MKYVHYYHRNYLAPMLTLRALESTVTPWRIYLAMLNEPSRASQSIDLSSLKGVSITGNVPDGSVCTVLEHGWRVLANRTPHGLATARTVLHTIVRAAILSPVPCRNWNLTSQSAPICSMMYSITLHEAAPVQVGMLAFWLDTPPAAARVQLLQSVKATVDVSRSVLIHVATVTCDCSYIANSTGASAQPFTTCFCALSLAT